MADSGKLKYMSRERGGKEDSFHLSSPLTLPQPQSTLEMPLCAILIVTATDLRTAAAHYSEILDS